MLTAGLAITATLLTIARGWPQTSRIAVHRNVSGVSSLTWTLMLSAHVAWIVWTAHLGVIPVLFANVLSAAGCIAVLLTISRHSELSRWRSLLTAVGSALLSLVLLRIGGSVFFSAVVTTLTAVMVVPQVLKAFHTDATGISAMTWWLSVASALVWPTYYFLIDRPVLIAPNVAIFVSAVLILSRIHAVRSAAVADPVAP